jgi:hypothetical protein
MCTRCESARRQDEVARKNTNIARRRVCREYVAFVAVCFSAEADFVSGAVIGVVGVATLAKVEHRRELALGVVPLALALHQVVEGFVWLGLDDKLTNSSSDLTVHVYVAFAWVVLPILLPLAILLVEPSVRRRRVMTGFVVLGAAVGLYLLSAMLDGNVTAHVAEHTIQYGGAGEYAGLATFFYVVATCGPPLLSSYRAIVWFGAANVVAVLTIAYVQADGLTSLWCAWAAVVSVLVYLQFSNWRRSGEPAEAWDAHVLRR